MTETQPSYLHKRTLTIDQEHIVDEYLTIIRRMGGYGVIGIVVEDGQIRFIRLESVSHKCE